MVSEEALALDPESPFVDRVQKLQALKRAAEAPSPPTAPFLGTRLHTMLKKKSLRLGAKKSYLQPLRAADYFASPRRNTASCLTAITKPVPA